MKDPLIILIVILAIVIVWRGPKTLPQIGHMLGRGVKEARKEAAEIKDEMRKDDSPAAATAAPIPPPAAPAAAPIVAVAPPPTLPPATPGPDGSGPA